MLLVITEEFRDDQSTGTLGKVFIRCNNILCIGSAIRGTVVYAYRRCRPRCNSKHFTTICATDSPWTHRHIWEEEALAPPIQQEWQKQVGGSLDEFNSYFEALSPEVEMRYKDEAKDLVARGIWVNGTADVIAKFSSLPMH
ncbi:hypothetical protein F5141DRAFT_1068893 [Pisolithus sp. B1]|nr:hypothetical protein F5141DRAFT_1068893 [Pisolithus sp. B1]